MSLIQSKIDKSISFERWDTPVGTSNELWLLRQLFTTSHAYFFFHKNHDSPSDEYYILTINGDDPFRLTEEGLGSNVIGGLVTEKEANLCECTKYRTFKIWDTPFAQNSFSGLAISEEEYDKKEKFQYLIYTQDTWIEFVAFKPPKWEFHQDKKLDDLVIQYLRKDTLD
jgi:hypothetical protein